MPLVYEGDMVRFDGHCTVEEALPLVQFLSETPTARVSLAGCDTLHTSLLQVLAAARPPVIAPPGDPMLAGIVDRLLGEER